MAIYQFVIQLIPKCWADNKGNTIGSLYDLEGFYDLGVAWEAYQQKTDLDNLLSQILSKKKSWSGNVHTWGNEEENDIQVFYLENHRIESIRFRLDIRKDIEVLKVKLIDVAKQLDCQLFLPAYKKVIVPDIAVLNETIAQSNAAKFARNPHKYLDEFGS